MTSFITRHTAKLATTLCMVGLLAVGCSTQKADTAPPEDIVAQRAAERWEALMALDHAKAYSYLAPSVRSVMSLDGFRRRLNLGLDVTEAPWTQADVRSVSCENPEVCEAKIFVAARIMVPQFSGMTSSAEVKERWVYQEGEWWLYMQ